MESSFDNVPLQDLVPIPRGEITMDVKDALNFPDLKEGAVELTGWIVDRADGLFILGGHYPENYDYPYRMKVINGNIIYSILKTIPSLAGGWSLLFYKAKIIGVLVDQQASTVNASRVFIQEDRNSEHFQEIDIRLETINAFVEKNGDYKFGHSRNPMSDWLDDF